MAHGGAKALARGAEQARAIRAGWAWSNRRHQRGEGRRDEERPGVHAEGEARPARREQQAPDEGTHSDLHVEGDADEGVGAKQLLLLDEVGKRRCPRGRVRGLQEGGESCERDEQAV